MERSFDGGGKSKSYILSILVIEIIYSKRGILYIHKKNPVAGTTGVGRACKLFGVYNFLQGRFWNSI